MTKRFIDIEDPDKIKLYSINFLIATDLNFQKDALPSSYLTSRVTYLGRNYSSYNYKPYLFYKHISLSIGNIQNYEKKQL